MTGLCTIYFAISVHGLLQACQTTHGMNDTLRGVTLLDRLATVGSGDGNGLSCSTAYKPCCYILVHYMSRSCY